MKKEDTLKPLPIDFYENLKTQNRSIKKKFK